MSRRAAALVRIGCAGWALRKSHAAVFPSKGSHLARYAQCFNAVEINSSFYRPHRRATYERWAASVPDDFAFAVKAPRTITHEHRLIDTASPLKSFLAEIAGLAHKLGPVLFQLPPKLTFESKVAHAFLSALRQRYTGVVAWEPRHASWFAAAADALLMEFDIARVVADPAIVPAAAWPGGAGSFAYFRLHGAPRIYYSEYDAASLQALAAQVRAVPNRRWVIFDNTALGAAIDNALALKRLLEASP
jgi:uncharacterized protein YecE (DUF72 family)